MSKYVTEDGTDFYKELYETLGECDIEDEDNVCPISGINLASDFVTLDCGHKFNYEPLLTEINNQKNVLKTYATIQLSVDDKSKLTGPYIVCPYCRRMQTKLLPLNNSKPIYGINTDQFCFMSQKDIHDEVNMYYKTFSFYSNKTCGATCKKTLYNENGEKYTEIIQCPKQYLIHVNHTNGYYCSTHLLSHFKNAVKEAKKKYIEDNTPMCIEILKSGVNKGKQCTAKVCATGGDKCSRHLASSLSSEKKEKQEKKEKNNNVLK